MYLFKSLNIEVFIYVFITISINGLDYSGKTIRPFTTHEGSGLSGVPRQLKDICDGAEVLDGIAITGSEVTNSKQKIEEWI